MAPSDPSNAQLDRYVAHDPGGPGRERCPVLGCDGGHHSTTRLGGMGVNVRETFPCGFCHGSGWVAGPVARAYRKRDLLNRAMDEVDRGTSGENGYDGPQVAARLIRDAERASLENDRDVLTVYLGLINDGPLLVDGYGLLETGEEAAARRAAREKKDSAHREMDDYLATCCPVCLAPANIARHQVGCEVESITGIRVWRTDEPALRDLACPRCRVPKGVHHVGLLCGDSIWNPA